MLTDSLPHDNCSNRIELAHLNLYGQRATAQREEIDFLACDLSYCWQVASEVRSIS